MPLKNVEPGLNPMTCADFSVSFTALSYLDVMQGSTSGQ
jgi:hypothetical protein